MNQGTTLPLGVRNGLCCWFALQSSSLQDLGQSVCVLLLITLWSCLMQVLENVSEVYRCKRCLKCYWEGPRSRKADTFIQTLFADEGAQAGEEHEAPPP